MQQHLYNYIDGFDVQLFHSRIPQNPQTPTLNRCQINILCEILSKSIVCGIHFPAQESIIHSLFHLKYIDPQHSWGLILSILTRSSTQSQALSHFYFNRSSTLRLQHLLESTISLFEPSLTPTLILALQQSLNTLSIPLQSITSPHLYTFQSFIPTLTLRFQQNNYNQKQILILSSLKQFFETNPTSTYRMFLSNIPSIVQSLNFVLYSKQWIKHQLERELDFKLIEVIELISQSVLIYQKSSNKSVFTKEEVEDIPYIYHFYIKHVIQRPTNQYPAFERFFYKYSDINKIINLCSISFLKTHHLYLQTLPNPSAQFQPPLHISFSDPYFVCQFLDKPQLYWKLLLKEYLKLSGIKFKKQNRDPLIFLMIDPALWSDKETSGLLSICFWMCIREWKEKMPSDHPKKSEYLQCMNKVLREFVKTLPLEITTLKEYR